MRIWSEETIQRKKCTFEDIPHKQASSLTIDDIECSLSSMARRNSNSKNISKVSNVTPENPKPRSVNATATDIPLPSPEIPSVFQNAHNGQLMWTCHCHLLIIIIIMQYYKEKISILLSIFFLEVTQNNRLLFNVREQVLATLYQHLCQMCIPLLQLIQNNWMPANIEMMRT